MDQQKLRTLVFEKTGVRIDVDDPVFALVALNEAVLAEAVERHVALLDQATAALATQADALLAGGTAPLAVSVSAAMPLPAGVPARATSAISAQDKRGAALAGAAALLGALLVLAGQALWFRQPPPVPVIMAKELTGEQALALKNAEKMSRIVNKLDQKTRNIIQTELQKP